MKRECHAGIRVFTAVDLAFTCLGRGLRQNLFPYDTTCDGQYHEADHLAAHPDQPVTEIAIGPDVTQTTPGTLALPVATLMCESDDIHTGIASCREVGKNMVCTLEGDAGSFVLRPQSKGLQLTVSPTA